jgi:hypothetical protein
MGSHRNIRHDAFPKQGSHLGKRVVVFYHYDTMHTCLGTVVRDDAQEPFVMIIQTDDGRFVKSTECQYADAAHAGGAPLSAAPHAAPAAPAGMFVIKTDSKGRVIDPDAPPAPRGSR